MTEFERFAEALAKTESSDCELTWGDPKHPDAPSYSEVSGTRIALRGRDFMAMGRWQMHPAWYVEWADPAIQVGWSWDQAFRAALKRFWVKETPNVTTEVDKAMIFHLGASAWARGEWDQAYGERFLRFWGQLGGA